MSADWWKQFPVTVSFLEPCKIAGVVEDLTSVKGVDGPYPRLTLRSARGQRFIVNATQTRLVSELVRAAPVLGDRICIVYSGPAGRAAPGMSPTKEFSVDVDMAGSGPGPGTDGTSGSATSENGPRAGNKKP